MTISVVPNTGPEKYLKGFDLSENVTKQIKYKHEKIWKRTCNAHRMISSM
jgi:hypothetical protein